MAFILLFLSHYVFMALDLSLFSLVRVGPRYMQSRWKKVLYIKLHITSHSAYVATETELDGAKIDGLLPPNIL